MAVMEDIESSKDQDSTFPMVHDSKMLANHLSIQDHNPMGCHTITAGFQQSISGCTGNSKEKIKSDITSFVAGNTRLRQVLNDSPKTSLMYLKRDYTTRLVVNFGDKHNHINDETSIHTHGLANFPQQEAVQGVEGTDW